MLSRRLRRSGYDVITAADGEEALLRIGDTPIGLVLLDNMMPGISGLDVLRSLRGRFSPAELPVIMVTAQTESELVVKALEAGANDFVGKPVDYPVALARIKNQLVQRSSEKALKESQERYALASLATQEGLWDWNLLTGHVYYSQRWKEMLGYAEDEIGDSSEEWLGRVHPADIEQVRLRLQAHNAGDTPRYECEHRIRQKSGDYLWVISRGLAARNSEGLATRITGSQTDITGSKLADPLTSLPNRLFLMHRLDSLLERSRGGNNGRLALLMMDLDGFKVINDSMGHLAGDRLMVEIAATLQTLVRSEERWGTDIAARLGGDEFAIVLQNIDSSADASAIAARIQQRFERPFYIEGRPVYASFSIGLAVCEAHRTADELLRDADTAMYYAKARGKHCFAVFDNGMRARAIERMELEADLHAAVEACQFVLLYQPRISLQTRRTLGFESLIRWAHPRRGLISPNEFIPLAEESGLIVPLGLWVLRQACSQLAEWQSLFPADPPLTISVNVSPRQLAEPGFPEAVAEVLAETRVAPGSVILEITESVLVRETEHVAAVLSALKKLGIGVELDDFGTGYSSLGYLQRFHVDGIKIDRSFVARLGSDDDSLQIVRSVLSLARGLGIDVIAEGIESGNQAAILEALACAHGQGFYFSRPIPPDAAKSFLEHTLNVA
jgi:diguanylate cyclase (GGDEF)-like protein/PAS domain S-box-containing protein